MRNRHFNSVKLYADIRRKCDELGCSFRQVAEDTGTKQYVFSRLRNGQSMHVGTVIPLLLWLGNTDLAPYILQDVDSEEEEEL